MGSIIRTAANNVGASGVFSSSAFNNASLNSVTSLPTAVDGKMKLIQSLTASNNATRSFTTGIDSTYKTYIFQFINIQPVTDGVQFQFQADKSTDTDYDQPVTGSIFYGSHRTDNAATVLEYNTGYDLEQATTFINLTRDQVGNASAENLNGELWLYNPSNTTYVKHYSARVNTHRDASGEIRLEDYYTAGYFNDGAGAINKVRFQFSSGNINAGTITMYGIA